ncbi:MAG: hypothetical protein KAS12_01055, partial [Candidatus Aenigmarchaeota archaeon]|nr:hypothetical protein [Candidatus Aenigmarchaeota archaeon]
PGIWNYYTSNFYANVQASLEYDCTTTCKSIGNLSYLESNIVNCNSSSCPSAYNTCYDNIDNDGDFFDVRPNGNIATAYNTLNSSGGIDCRYLFDYGDPDCNNTYMNISGIIGLCQLKNETTCDDNFDNDQDYGNTNQEYPYRTGWAGNLYGGNIVANGADCDDYSCSGDSYCPSIESNSDCKKQSCPAEKNWCGDGIDNDLDKYQKDGHTLNSSGGVDCTNSPSTWDVDCNNTYIADGSGKGKYCELGFEQTCNDNFDNDLDGNPDCTDYDCSGSSFCPKTERNDCADTLDNDLDYLIDCADPDCDGKMGPTGICEYGAESICDDNKDGDNDGYTDCYDEDCYGASDLCPVTEYGFNWKTTCDDNDDNDLDGECKTYDQNGDCIESKVQNEDTVLEDHYWSNSLVTGIDCSDNDCYQKGGNCYPCPSTENILIDSCSDGLDNDADGSYDCSDADCVGEIGPGGAICEDSTETICDDGLDNDGDGKIDCLGAITNWDTDCGCTTTELIPGGCNDGVYNEQIYTAGNIANCIENTGSHCTNYADYDCGGVGEETYDGNWIIGGYTNPSAECQYSVLCYSNDTNYPSTKTTTLDVFDLEYSDYVIAGDNFTITYANSDLDLGSLNIWLGSSSYSLGQLTSDCSSNTYIIGPNASEFSKQCQEGIFVQAQDSTAYDGDLNITLVISTNISTIPDDYTIETEISYPDSPTIKKQITFYVAENELPFTNITYPLNTTYELKNITILVDANDSIGNTYDSGIEYCDFKLDDESWIKSNNCTLTYTNLSEGAHIVFTKATDNSRNTGEIKNVTFTITEIPVQNTSIITDSTPANYINNTENPVLSVNFTSSKGFNYNASGCLVYFWNRTGSLVATETITLDNTTINVAVCNGSIDSDKQKGHYKIGVSVYDKLGVLGVSENISTWMCVYGFVDGDWRCLTDCEVSDPPIINEVNITQSIYRENNITITANITPGDYAIDTVNWPSIRLRKPYNNSFEDPILFDTNNSDIYEWNITVNSTDPVGLWSFIIEVRDNNSLSDADSLNSMVRGKLNLTILYPIENQNINKGNYIDINATVKDEFGNTPNTNDVIWIIIPNGQGLEQIST